MDERNGCEVIVIEMCKWIVSSLYTRIYIYIYDIPGATNTSCAVSGTGEGMVSTTSWVKGARRWKGQDLVM